MQVTHIQVHGLASGAIIAKFSLSENDLKTDLLKLLRSQEIPIASSCFGEGVCKKCLVNNSMMACKIRPLDLPKTNGTIRHITISYL